MCAAENSAGERGRAEALLRLMTTRRVVREFAEESVSRDDLVRILIAGRWATRGSNSRIHRFLVVQDMGVIRRVREFSPGMLGWPTALIVICLDEDLAAQAQVQLDRDNTIYVDVGTAAMNMMLAAHVLGLGSCPVTSFSKSAVGVVLGLPKGVTPEFIVQLGHPKVPPAKAASRFSEGELGDLVYWGRYSRP